MAGSAEPDAGVPPAPSPRTLSGLVLAGGAARRLGGEKAGRELAGRSLLSRALDTARTSCDDVWLLGGERSLEAPGVPRLADDPRFAGPLAGLAAGLAAARQPWSLLLACDQPFVDPGVIGALAARAAAHPDVLAIVLEDEHGLQPFCGLYNRWLLTVLDQPRSDHSLRGLLAGVPHLAVPVADEAGRRCLVDVDTPADLERARGLAGELVGA